MRATISAVLLILGVTYHEAKYYPGLDSLVKRFAEEGLDYAEGRKIAANNKQAMKLTDKKEKIFDIHEFQPSEELNDIQLQSRARLYTGQLLVDAFNVGKSDIKSFLEGISLKDTALGKDCKKKEINSSTEKEDDNIQPRAAVEFRSYDGSGNNVANTDWGKTQTLFRRILSPDYGNGLNTPRESSSGGSLPSARYVSQLVATELDKPYDDLSLMLMQWGQFLDHDITQTPVSTNSGSSISCCEDGDVISNEEIDAECFPIVIPDDDPFYSPFKATCMNFVRSECGISGDCTVGVRQQLNTITTFIDGSNIYGSNKQKARSLRTLSGGKLTMSNTDDHPLLPEDSEICSISGAVCYLAGDARVNVQVDLTIMQTIWAREHNRIAGLLAGVNPSWNDERLYQETRRIVGAELQHITYNEFLPIVLGNQVMEANNLLPSTGHTSQYDSTLDPTISNAFSTAAYRFGHSLIDGTLKMYTDSTTQTGSLLLHEQFLNPTAITSKDKFLALVNGLNFQPSQKSDEYFTTSVSQRLFQSNDKFGFDLVARNIQRGRDHGLPSYGTWRQYCKGSWDGTFDGLKSNIPDSVVSALNTAYSGNIDDIDLYIAGVAEEAYSDGIVGQTFNCILLDTFNRLKKGDRFFYEESGAQAFSTLQLTELKKVTLSKVICDNAGVTQYPSKAFYIPSNSNPISDCSGIAGMDLSKWA